MLWPLSYGGMIGAPDGSRTRDLTIINPHTSIRYRRFFVLKFGANFSFILPTSLPCLCQLGYRGSIGTPGRTRTSTVGPSEGLVQSNLRLSLRLPAFAGPRA